MKPCAWRWHRYDITLNMSSEWWCHKPLKALQTSLGSPYSCFIACMQCYTGCFEMNCIEDRKIACKHHAAKSHFWLTFCLSRFFFTQKAEVIKYLFSSVEKWKFTFFLFSGLTQSSLSTYVILMTEPPGYIEQWMDKVCILFRDN